MKNNNSKYRWICIWLAIIALLLLCGVILFAAYVYKFDPLSPVSELFQTDADVIWSAINVIATIFVGAATVCVSIKLKELQESQAYIEKQQHLLHTEPHILIDSLDVKSAECELTADSTMIKTLKDIDYPYYVNTLETENLNNLSIITVTFVNTSEAFARLRFGKATLKHNDDDMVANYNGSTFGGYRSHIMLKGGGTGKIGLLIRNDTIEKLSHSKLTISTFLDNNFKECYKDEQSYQIIHICEEIVTFMPLTISKNTFQKVE